MQGGRLSSPLVARSATAQRGEQMEQQGSFDDNRLWVEAMVMTGQPLESVEADIGDMRLPDEQRDALWLFAWSLQKRRRRFGRRPPPLRAPDRFAGAR